MTPNPPERWSQPTNAIRRTCGVRTLYFFAFLVFQNLNMYSQSGFENWSASMWINLIKVLQKYMGGATSMEFRNQACLKYHTLYIITFGRSSTIIMKQRSIMKRLASTTTDFFSLPPGILIENIIQFKIERLFSNICTIFLNLLMKSLKWRRAHYSLSNVQKPCKSSKTP